MTNPCIRLLQLVALGALSWACAAPSAHGAPVTPRTLAPMDWFLLADTTRFRYEHDDARLAWNADELAELWDEFSLLGNPPLVHWERALAAVFAFSERCGAVVPIGVRITAGRQIALDAKAGTDCALTGPLAFEDSRTVKSHRLIVIGLNRAALPQGRLSAAEVVPDSFARPPQALINDVARRRGRLKDGSTRMRSKPHAACKLDYPCPVIEIRHHVASVRLPDGGHAWLRLRDNHAVTVVALEQPAWWLEHARGSLLAAVYPSPSGFAGAGQLYDQHGRWVWGERRSRSLEGYEVDWVDDDHVRIVARTAGAWDFNAPEPPEDSDELQEHCPSCTPHYLEALAREAHARICTDCHPDLWKGIPAIRLADLARHNGFAIITDATLFYGGGEEARLDTRESREGSGFSVLAASALAAEPASRWTGPILLRRCGTGVCDLLLLDPRGGHHE